MTLRRTGRLERRRPLDRGTGLVRGRMIPRHHRGVGELADQVLDDVDDRDIPPATRELLAERSRGRCELARFDAGCTQAATDAHHRKRRRDGGHAIANLVHLCRRCHAWAHANPAEARDLGVIVSAFADPATTPLLVLSRLTGERRPALLTTDGGYLL